MQDNIYWYSEEKEKPSLKSFNAYPMLVLIFCIVWSMERSNNNDSEMRASVHLIQETLRHLDPTQLDNDDLASLVVALSPLPRVVYAPDDFSRRVQSYVTRRDEHYCAEIDARLRETIEKLESDPEWPHFIECVDSAWTTVHSLQKFLSTISVFPHEISLAALKKWSPWPGPCDNFKVLGQMTIHFHIDTTEFQCVTTRITISEIFTTTYAWPTLEIRVRLNRLSGSVITDTVRIIAPDPLACPESDGYMAIAAAHSVGATIIDLPPASALHLLKDRIARITQEAA